MSQNQNESWMRDKRESLKLSQQDVCDVLGVSRPTVISWEMRRTFPRKKHIPVLAALFKMQVRDVAMAVSTDRHARDYWDATHLGERVEAKR